MAAARSQRTTTAPGLPSGVRERRWDRWLVSPIQNGMPRAVR